MASPVPYLEDHDFDSRGNLVQHALKDKPLMVMVQASWCGGCRATKPAFEKFAQTNLLNTAFIQLDGSRPSQQNLAMRVDKISPERSEYIPSFFVITPSGKKFMYKDGSSFDDLVKAAHKIKQLA